MIEDREGQSSQMDPMYPNAYGQETLTPPDSTKCALSHAEKQGDAALPVSSFSLQDSVIPYY